MPAGKAITRRTLLREIAALGVATTVAGNRATAGLARDASGNALNGSFLDFRSVPDGTTLDADICIIGAGAAGITIARELAGSASRVCIVESGGLDYEADTQALYDGFRTGLDYFELDASRLRYFGGSTNHWGNWCAPLDEIDFMPREWVPDSGWPIRKEDLEPYYARSQQICGVGRYEYGPALWRDLGIEAAPRSLDGIDIRFWQIRWPARRFGVSYGEALRRAENVTVLLHANVVNIVSDSSNSGVSHVNLRALHGNSGRVRARVFVLACGGIENARLLLLSDRTAPNGLGNEHGLVGRFFMEHPQMHCATISTTRSHAEMARFFQVEHDGLYYQAGVGVPTEAQGIHRLLNHRFSFEKSTTSGEAGSSSGTWHIAVKANLEQAPSRESRVQLDTRRDALGLRRTWLNWKLSGLERDSLKRSLTGLGHRLARNGLGRLQMRDWLEQHESGWPDSFDGQFHHMGTTRMAKDSRQGVVDEHCRVHGLSNLYIAGSSVFPTGGNANPTLTIVALALKLTDHLKASRF